jgi:hypothetical protein
MALNKVASWQDFQWRLAELTSSMKYHLLVLSFIALMGHSINGTEFTILASLVLSGRVLTDIKWNGSQPALTTTPASGEESPSA